MAALMRLQKVDLSLGRRFAWCVFLAMIPLLAFRIFQPDPYFPDEYAHYDVMATIATGDLPMRFSQASGKTADLFACTDLRFGAPLLCGQRGQDASRLPWLGENAASAAAIFFHQVEGRVASIISQSAGVTLISALRGLSLIWTLALALVAVWLSTLVGASGAGSVAVGLLCVTNPLVLSQSAVIQTDVAAACLALTAIAAALVRAPTLGSVVASSTLAALGLLTRWSALIAPVTMLALQWYAGPRRTRALRCLVPAIPVLVAAVLAALDSVFRGGLTSNGLQDQYVREHWDQNPVMAVMLAWIRIPVTLSYPFSSSPARPGAGMIEAAWACVVTATVCVVVARFRSPRGLSSRWGALATGALVYLMCMPVITIATLMAMGIPLFHQPRYLLPGVLLAIVLVASRPRTERYYIAAAGGLWITTGAFILLG